MTLSRVPALVTTVSTWPPLISVVSFKFGKYQTECHFGTLKHHLLR